MKIFNRIKEVKASSHPELIFLHIRKTAGTSFVNILKQIYGRRNVGSLHIETIGDGEDWRLTHNTKLITPNQLELREKILYGHFAYKQLQQFVSPSEQVPIITWLRRPTKRVESAYHYANEIYKRELSEKHPRFNILNSLKRDFLEYASMEENRNEMSKMLSGVDLEQLFFVGLVEHFEEDLAYLAKKLGWKNYTVPHSNRTAARLPLPPYQRKALRAWNQEDIALYKRAQELRNRR